MPLKIVRNDITKMEVDAVVNTASASVHVGPGCDQAIYDAAGYDLLLNERRKIGEVAEGEAFITDAFNLPCKKIIHAVSPLFVGDEEAHEIKLRACYKNSLKLAIDNGINSIAFPLISTGSFGFPKEEGLRIALDEINAFLINHNMLVYIVVFDKKSSDIASKLFDGLKSYIDDNYVDSYVTNRIMPMANYSMPMAAEPSNSPSNKRSIRNIFRSKAPKKSKSLSVEESFADYSMPMPSSSMARAKSREDSLDDRIAHMSDSFSEYLMYLIERKGMTNSEVYKRGIVDKKLFSKLKNNPGYHPQKITAMCLCVGAMLNLDDTKDLLARAGYALSPCDKTDVIFSYFIEHEIFDMIEIDLALEEHGLPCLIE